MHPIDFYNNQISKVNTIITHLKTRRNLLTFAKITLFLLTIFFIVYFANTANTLWIGFSALSIAFFILLNVLETRLLERIEYNQSLKKIAEIEIEYLDGNLDNLDEGNEFKNPNHSYSHDLDIFGKNSIFQTINRTVTPYGKETLSEWLQNPLKDKEQIITRQNAIRELKENPYFSNEFRASVYKKKFSSNLPEEVSKWKNTNYRLSGSNVFTLYIIPAITILCWIVAIYGMINYKIPLFFSLIQLLIVGITTKKFNKAHSNLNLVISSFNNLSSLIKLIHSTEFKSDKLKKTSYSLFENEVSALEGIGELTFFKEKFDQRSNQFVAIVFNGLFSRDIHLYRKLLKWKEKYVEFLPKWMESLSELDALNSLAIYNFNNQNYIFPEINESTILNCVDLGHPLLYKKNCITNNFKIQNIHEFYIITGANMAGKSTFLRAVGVNFVLACCGSVVNAKQMEFYPMSIFTSMRTVDDLSKGTSYFHAELIRLKSLVDTAKKEEKVFIILDEILKGTNSVDKLNGSKRFLQKLLSLPISGLVATHDLELGKLADIYPENYFNYCFEITHTVEDILYDYKLKKGISQNMNASILLEKMNLCIKE